MTQAEIFPCRFPGRVKAAFTSPKRPHAKACLSCSRFAQERARHGRQKKHPLTAAKNSPKEPLPRRRGRLPSPLLCAEPHPFRTQSTPSLRADVPSYVFFADVLPIAHTPGGATGINVCILPPSHHCPHARRRNAVRPGLSLFLCRAPDPLRPAPSTVPPLKGKREYLFRRKTFTKKNTCEKIIHKPVKPTTSPVCQRGKVQH